MELSADPVKLLTLFSDQKQQEPQEKFSLKKHLQYHGLSLESFRSLCFCGVVCSEKGEQSHKSIMDCYFALRHLILLLRGDYLVQDELHSSFRRYRVEEEKNGRQSSRMDQDLTRNENFTSETKKDKILDSILGRFAEGGESVFMASTRFKELIKHLEFLKTWNEKLTFANIWSAEFLYMQREDLSQRKTNSRVRAENKRRMQKFFSIRRKRLSGGRCGVKSTLTCLLCSRSFSTADQMEEERARSLLRTFETSFMSFESGRAFDRESTMYFHLQEHQSVLSDNLINVPLEIAVRLFYTAQKKKTIIIADHRSAIKSFVWKDNFCSLNKVSNDIVESQILPLLDARSICCFLNSSKKFNRQKSYNLIWKYHCETHFLNLKQLQEHKFVNYEPDSAVYMRTISRLKSIFNNGQVMFQNGSIGPSIDDWGRQCAMLRLKQRLERVCSVQRSMSSGYALLMSVFLVNAPDMKGCTSWKLNDFLATIRAPLREEFHNHITDDEDFEHPSWWYGLKLECYERFVHKVQSRRTFGLYEMKKIMDRVLHDVRIVSLLPRRESMNLFMLGISVSGHFVGVTTSYENPESIAFH